MSDDPANKTPPDGETKPNASPIIGANGPISPTPSPAPADTPVTPAQPWPRSSFEARAAEAASAKATPDPAPDANAAQPQPQLQPQPQAQKSSIPPLPSAKEVMDEVSATVKGASEREPYGWFAGASLAFTGIWLIWWEDDAMGFWKLKLWTLFILAAVGLVFAPALRKQFKLTEARAAELSVAGAAGMGFAWVAFLLPNIQTNQAFFGTLAVACAGIAAWMAPGRPKDPA